MNENLSFLVMLAAVLLISGCTQTPPAGGDGNGATTCVGEGEYFITSYGDTAECCQGLTQISCDSVIEGSCFICFGSFYCTYCGNGVCLSPENECNCPEDCSGSVQTCTDYDEIENTPAQALGVYGECFDSTGSHYDYCLDGYLIAEYQCFGTSCDYTVFNCTIFNYKGGCVDGTCVAL